MQFSHVMRLLMNMRVDNSLSVLNQHSSTVDFARDGSGCSSGDLISIESAFVIDFLHLQTVDGSAVVRDVFPGFD